LNCHGCDYRLRRAGERGLAETGCVGVCGETGFGGVV